MDKERAIKVISSIQEVQGFDARLERVKDFINQQAETIESLKCCGNCKYNVAGTLKCIKDVFDIKCFYRDGTGGKHWESDNEPLPSM